jgi:hypothetical protein
MTLKQDFGVGVTQQTIKCHDYLILRKKIQNKELKIKCQDFNVFKS